MSALQSECTTSWSGGLAFRPFDVESTSLNFSYSRRSFDAEHSLVASNISAVYSPYFQETLIGGVLQGRKPSDPRGASIISRRRMWSAAAEVASVLSLNQVIQAIDGNSYSAFKTSPLLACRREVKADVLHTALKGWLRNDGDGDFSLGLEDYGHKGAPSNSNSS
jgi:tRNA-specific adenosine deaminase 1